MEKYKKKSLNFMGYSRELRKTERENQRYAFRQQRFSIIRMLENESITEEKKEISSRIPTIGKPKDQAASRVEMLQKWKQEKMVKKQQESKLKKPAFKVGVINPNPPPSLGFKPLFALDTSSRLYKSSFQVSNSQLSIKKQESLNASNTKTNAKVSNSQVSDKKPENTVNMKTGAKDVKIQSCTSKTGVVRKPESKWTRNKESGIQSLAGRSKVDPKSNINKDQVSSNKKQPTIGSRPLLETKKIISSSGLPKASASRTSSNDHKQIPSVLPKATRTLSTESKQIPSSGLPKASASRTLSKDRKQIPSSVLPKATRTLSTETKQAIPKKNNVVKSIPKFSKSVASQQKGNISEKTSRSESKVPTKPESDCPTNKPDEVIAFECELSHIEPVEDERKSFAPPGFMFQPPVELNSSLFLEGGPAAIFMRVKNKYLRTSTPKQSPSSKKSSLETEDSKCLKNEDKSSEKDEHIQSPKDEKKNEDVLCSKSADNNLRSPHKYEALLSSSLETICLNDTKPIDCKQSLKFEFPEVVSTQNQEEMLLPSKITQPELSMATKSGAINPPILTDSTEMNKTEINSPTNTEPTDDNKIIMPFPGVDSVLSEVKFNPTHIVKSIDYQQSRKFEFPEIVSTWNEEEGFLSSNIMFPKNSLAGEPTSNGAMNSPILPDSAEVDKTAINSTDPEDDNKITVPFLKLDSFVPEIIPNPVEPDENSENDQRVSNGFLQKQGSAPLKYETVPKKINSRVTYDFDKLSSETEEDIHPRNTRGGKVSLLYTPPNKSRPSIMRHSIRGDLMSFSPNT